MATLNGIIQYNGKLGQTVGMKGTKGRNYLRAKVTPRNPRSNAQCIQRMIMATVATSISKLTEVCDNSVENIQHGNPTLSYLKGQWMRMLRENVRLLPPSRRGPNFLKKGEDRFAANPYLLSKGKLSPVDVRMLNGGVPYLYSTYTDEPFERTFSQTFPTAKLGDQITLVQIIGSEDHRTEVFYCRFAATTNSAPLFVDDRLNPAVLDLSKCEGPWDKVFFGNHTVAPPAAEQAVAFNFESLSSFDETDILASAVIVSNKEEETRSTSYLVVNPDIDNIFPYRVAAPTYGDTASSMNVPSDIYLNNSTDPDEAGLAVIQLPDSAFPFPAGSQNFQLKFGAKPTEVYLELQGQSAQFQTPVYLLSNNLLLLGDNDELEGYGDGHIILVTPSQYNDATNELTFATGADVGQNLKVTGGFAIINGERVDIYAAQ